jgi:tRNA(fMet)-specific endonuclease VapC
MMIADTDLLIDFLRGKEPGHGRVRIELATGHLATTAVNQFELLSGARTAREQEKVAQLLSALRVLALDEEASRRAAQARRELEARGEGIGMADYLIAGVCLAHGGTLLTRNVQHFSRIPDLRVGGKWPEPRG